MFNEQNNRLARALNSLVQHSYKNVTRRSSAFSGQREPRRWIINRDLKHKTKGLMSKTMALHLRCKSLCISLPSSAKQQREITKIFLFWTTWTTTPIFVFSFRIERWRGIACATSETDRRIKQICIIAKIMKPCFSRHRPWPPSCPLLKVSNISIWTLRSKVELRIVLTHWIHLEIPWNSLAEYINISIWTMCSNVELRIVLTPIDTLNTSRDSVKFFSRIYKVFQSTFFRRRCCSWVFNSLLQVTMKNKRCSYLFIRW